MNTTPPRSAGGSPARRRAGEGCRVLGKVTARDSLGGMVRLTVRVPGWRAAKPGQFALLQAEPSGCFLARAFSVSDQAADSVSFIIAQVGQGTGELCSLRRGAPVWALGPLGNGFDVDALAESPGRAVIVAGGVGIAPFPLLLTELAGGYQALFAEGAGAPAVAPASAGADPTAPTGPSPDSVEVLVLLGFRDAEQARGARPVQEAALALGRIGVRCRLEIATEDGSRGPAEKVTDLLERHLRPGDRVVACGPEAMAAAVWHICSTRADVGAWFSLEAGMACGVGSCHGCAVTLADGSLARVCHDGPVFPGERVFGGTEVRGD